MIGQDEVVVGKLSLTHCFQAGPSKPLLRDDHLALKSSPSHPVFEALREANTLSYLGWRSLPRGDRGCRAVPEASPI